MNEQAAVGDGGRFWQKGRPLRVPLNAKNAPVFMLQGFDYAVPGCLRDGKRSSDGAAALMMRAVDQAGVLIKLKEERAGHVVCRMDLIPPFITVPVCGGQILDQGSAEVDVDDLHASADAKNRFPAE